MEAEKHGNNDKEGELNDDSDDSDDEIDVKSLFFVDYGDDLSDQEGDFAT